jgi:hypothetical protein
MLWERHALQRLSFSLAGDCQWSMLRPASSKVGINSGHGTSEIIVTSLNAEIVDLDAYRQRRAAIARAATASVPASIQDWTVPGSFFMPFVFFVFWSGWVISPQFVTAQSEGRHGPV